MKNTRELKLTKISRIEVVYQSFSLSEKPPNTIEIGATLGKYDDSGVWKATGIEICVRHSFQMYKIDNDCDMYAVISIWTDFNFADGKPRNISFYDNQVVAEKEIELELLNTKSILYKTQKALRNIQYEV